MYVDVLTRGVDQAGEVHHVVLEVDGPTHFLHSPDGPPELSPVDELKAAALLLHGVPVRPIRVSKMTILLPITSLSNCFLFA